MTKTEADRQKALSQIRKRIQEKYPDIGVELTELGSVRLVGERDSYQDIVSIGGMAVDKRHNGVVNDIKLKGFVDTSKRIPKIRDSVLEGERPDVLIIGAGITGVCIARELSRYELKVLVVEKEYDVALGASSRNDGDVHVGIDLHKEQLKHYYNDRGNAMYSELCKELDVDFQRTGHIIWLLKKWEPFIIYPAIKLRAKQLGIKGVKLLKGDRMSKYEKNIPSWTTGGIYMPTGGEVSPYKLTVAVAENSAMNGVKYSFDTIVEDVTVKDDLVTAVTTNRGIVYPKLIINAAGVYSDVIAEMCHDRTFTIHPRKGTNLILDKKVGKYAMTSMNKTPFTHFKDENVVKGGHTKGGGIVHTVDDNVLVGPTAEETPYREDCTTDSDVIKMLVKKHSRVAEKMKLSDVITYFSGVRSPTYEEDFVVRKGIKTKNIVEAAGIQSPGLTAAPAIAVDVAEFAVDLLGGANKNKSFNPIRKAPPHLNKMSVEERNKLIKQNPDYGEIVCRCEEISKGEILDALHSPIPVYTLDAIKRRVRPGMGRCQGGFCSPLVNKIISNEKNCKLEEINKGGDGSYILTGNAKETDYED